MVEKRFCLYLATKYSLQQYTLQYKRTQASRVVGTLFVHLND